MKSTETIYGIIGRIIGNYLFAEDCGGISDYSIDAVFSEASEQSVFPTVYCALKEAGNVYIPDMYEKKYKKLLYKNLRVDALHGEVASILRDNEIPYTLIKGYSSAVFYPQPEIRSMGDCDVLIDKKYSGKAKKLFEDNGFVFSRGHDKEHHISCVKNSLIVEIHTDINGIPKGKTGKKIRELLADTISTAVEKETPYGKMMLPDTFHTGLIQLLHIARHTVSSGMGMRHLCDWACFVNSLESFDEVFRKPFEEIGLYRFANIFTAVAVKYLGLCAETKPFEEELIDGVFFDMAASGNFGKKRGDSRESAFTAKRSGGGIGKKSKLLQLISFSADITREHWSISRRLVILVPVGCIYFSMRYLLRALAGKRKMPDFPALFEKSEKRLSLYRKFKLFVPEKNCEIQRKDGI